MNHEARIKELEKRIETLEQLIPKKAQWIPLKEAIDTLGISKTVIYNRIRKNILVKGKDYKLNGNRYLLNVSSVEKKVC